MTNISRLALLSLALTGAALAGGCVITPGNYGNQPGDVNKMSEQALATCGAGQVKEVNAKSFSCK